jgi:hypothetical protein
MPAINAITPRPTAIIKFRFFVLLSSSVSGLGFGLYSFYNAIPIGTPRANPIAGPKARFPIARPIGMPKEIPITYPIRYNATWDIFFIPKGYTPYNIKLKLISKKLRMQERFFKPKGWLTEGGYSKPSFNICSRVQVAIQIDVSAAP